MPAKGARRTMGRQTPHPCGFELAVSGFFKRPAANLGIGAEGRMHLFDRRVNVFDRGVAMACENRLCLL